MAFLLSGMALQTLFLDRARKIDVAWVEPPREARGKLDPRIFQTSAAGQMASAVDWLVLRFLSDPAYSHVTEGRHSAAFYDLDLATDIDPAFYDLYVHGAGFLAVVREDIDGSLEILKKGEKFRTERLADFPTEFQKNYWPQPWALPFVLGFVQLFEKQNLPAAVKAFQSAADYPDSPRYLKALVQRFSDPSRYLENAIRILDIMLAGTKNPQTLEKLGRHRNDLVILAFMKQVNEDYRKTGKFPANDPAGGRLSVGSNGRIVTSTPIRNTLGIVDAQNQ